MPLFYNILTPSAQGVIQNGLVINLDASYNASYPKSGTTWFDISPVRKNFTLINGPTFEYINQGVINFDGTNDNATATTITGGVARYSVNTWFLIKAYPSSNLVIPAIFTQGFGASGSINFALSFDPTATTTNQIFGGYFDGTNWQIAGGFTPALNTWYNVCFTYQPTGNVIRFYLNGSLLNQVNATASLGTLTTQGYFLARRWDRTEFLNGKIGVINLYNRVLTDDEVKFNYDTLKGRYI